VQDSSESEPIMWRNIILCWN